MKIKIKSNAEQLYQNTTTAKITNYKFWLEWRSVMRSIQGTTIEVETNHLFKDQYNTVPLPGVSENGLRVLDYIVDGVIDDDRIGRGKCSWCGHHSIKSEKGCQHCEKGLEYMEWFDDYFKKMFAITSGELYKKRGYDIEGKTL